MYNVEQEFSERGNSAYGSEKFDGGYKALAGPCKVTRAHPAEPS